MLHILLVLAALPPFLAALPAQAQPRPFNCVGAEKLEEDVFAIPFARGAAAPGEAARSNLAAAAELARREPERRICVLGHAAAREGGATTGVQLAAKRAGQVAAALAKLGVERDRIRAEARRANFARGVVPEERSVTVVLLPALPPEAKPAEPARTPDAKPQAAPAAARPAPAAPAKAEPTPAARPAAGPAPVPAGRP
ncbi:OmpA family protein [Roseicella aquatilis]|uniref:OmpA-like domain-containing protein n=1 Tax=Roseicella aquatilis TaxID=2527868 RepID=A0A4R4DUZ4_9PROT|nr:OmpA family protein [Roseicella aquatilis]TCZ66103.1 hypothetical protein EXY23_03240 [Roseicella aquatilis]